MQDERFFSCSDIINKKLAIYFKLTAALIILSVFFSGLFSFVVYTKLKRKMYNLYFNQNKVTEQIYGIQIDYNGNVLRNVTLRK